MSDSTSKRFPVFPALILLAFIAALTFASIAGGEQQPRQASKNYSLDYRKFPHPASFHYRQLRVALPYEKSLPRAASPFGPGMDEELLSIFLEENGYAARFIYARTSQEAMDLLKSKHCDLVVGFGGDLSNPGENPLEQSPAYASFYPVVVHSPGSADQVYSNVLRNSLKSLSKSSGRKARNLDAILLDPHTYSVLVPLYDDVRTGGSLSESVGYRWFWLGENQKLGEQLAAFWSGEHQEMLAEMRERYYGFMPKKAKHQDLRALAAVVSDKMELYTDAIMKASEETGLDPLLLAAVIFQESRFDPAAQSSTGVRGIMQLTTSTAKMLKVDRLDPEQCIMGGARYLNDIYQSLDGLENISDWDRWCLTLAAYNQGPGNLRKALRKADSDGKAKNWTEMREVYKQLARTTSGLRGQEAVSFVENVRYYYYVMSRLASVAQSEEKNFAPLLLLSAAY